LRLKLLGAQGQSSVKDRSRGYALEQKTLDTACVSAEKSARLSTENGG